MSDKFTVEIITPDKLILKSEVNEVTIPSYEGQMGILKDHIPLITFLRPGVIFAQGKEEEKYYVEEGTVEFSNNNLLILTSTARDLTDLNQSFIEDCEICCNPLEFDLSITDNSIQTFSVIPVDQ